MVDPTPPVTQLVRRCLADRTAAPAERIANPIRASVTPPPAIGNDPVFFVTVPPDAVEVRLATVVLGDVVGNVVGVVVAGPEDGELEDGASGNEYAHGSAPWARVEPEKSKRVAVVVIHAGFAAVPVSSETRVTVAPSNS